MTKSEIQPEDKAPMFAKGQKIWVEARICNDELDRYGDLKLNITYSHGSCLAHCLPSEIRTTEQIVQEHGALAPQNDQYKNWEWDEESEVWRPKTANEGGETPQEAELTEPDSTRKLEKGDNVRIVEYDGRIPTLETFKVGDIYEVATKEDVYGDVYLFDEISGRHEIVPWIFLELVELARKYKLFEKMGEYQIYDTQQGRTKASFSKEIYTFEEVQAECDRLNKRQETNENA